MTARVVWQGRVRDCRCRIWVEGQHARVQWLRPDGSSGLYPQRSDGSNATHWHQHEALAFRTAVRELAERLEDSLATAIEIDEP